MKTERIIAIYKPGYADVTFHGVNRVDVSGMERMAEILGHETTVRMFSYDENGDSTLNYMNAFEAAKTTLAAELEEFRAMDDGLIAAMAISPDYSKS